MFLNIYGRYTLINKLSTHIIQKIMKNYYYYLFICLIAFGATGCDSMDFEDLISSDNNAKIETRS